METKLENAIRAALTDGELTCARAFHVAEEVGVSPRQVGLAADEMGLRLIRCQLGLFGYGPKAEGKHKIVKPMENVPAALEQAIHEAIDGKGITCAAAWEIAKRLGIPKMDVSSAAETLGVKITVCQLGAFPRPKTS